MLLNTFTKLCRHIGILQIRIAQSNYFVHFPSFNQVSSISFTAQPSYQFLNPSTPCFTSSNQLRSYLPIPSDFLMGTLKLSSSP